MTQNWYCEQEDCGVCINEQRYQCAGCGGWYCAAHIQPLGPLFWVCTTCQAVWSRLREAEEQAFCPLCDQVREDANRRLCRECDRWMDEANQW
ncbi:MAG TPA: hypothetical protein VKV40_18520 [Ktedonobacteraceae bacterium]|nr:hypothetical protein [Ktedonobacteraceae bacterium]